MRPYPGLNLDLKKQAFNFRLSRGRRVIENAFGVLVARWRILLTTIPHYSLITIIVRACVCLHNYLKSECREYCPPGFVDSEMETNGLWRSEVTENLTPLQHMGTNYSTNRNRRTRDLLADYFYENPL